MPALTDGLPVTLEDVQQALTLPRFDGLAAQRQMMPMPRRGRPLAKAGQARLGGVLLLLYYQAGELCLVLTRRRDDLPSHAGQISFPGGRHEPPETLLMTALRETYEEIGVQAAELSVLGELTPLYIPPSDYEVHPFVAWYKNGRQPVFSPHTREVAEILEVPLSHLLDPATRVEETWQLHGYKVVVPFFAVQEHKVWGATAMMLSEFLARLRTAKEIVRDA
jgi:8-oxo-dGTP pyrophosphatase MutT (NUDIX family)